MDHLGINLDQILWVPIIAEIGPEFLRIITPTRFAIYFDTLGVSDMQFSELICISDIHMDHLGINLDQFLWVPRIAEISPRIFEDNYPYQISNIL